MKTFDGRHGGLHFEVVDPLLQTVP